MKKIALFFFAFFGCIYSSIAQLQVQLETGGILSTLRPGSPNANRFMANTSTSSKADYHLAGITFIRLPQRFGFYTGISFDNKGADFSQPQYANRDQRSLSIQYLGIPAGISYTLFKTNQISVSPAIGIYGAMAFAGIESGTYYNDATATTSIIHNALTISATNTSNTLPTVIHRFDWGAQASIQGTTGRYSLSLQFSYGLRGVLTNPDLYDRQYYNQSIGLFLGYRL